MKKITTNLLSFNRSQQRSIFLLIILLSSLLAYRNIHLFVPSNEDHSYQLAENAKTIIALQQQVANMKDNDHHFSKSTSVKQSTSRSNVTKHENQISSVPQKKTVQIILAAFDPNQASKAQLLELGMSSKIANILIKYRNAGGKFYQPDDLKKVFGITDSFYQTVQPYINIESTKNAQSVIDTITTTFKGKDHFKKKVYTSVEINSITAEELRELPGIGPSYSERIIKYRDLLGGYSDIHQLTEVYGFPDSTYQKLKPYILVDTSRIEKIDLISSSKEELSSHRYISWKQAKLIKNYVYQHLTIQSKDELYNIKAIDSIDMRQILPYLEIQNNDFTETNE